VEQEEAEVMCVARKRKFGGKLFTLGYVVQTKRDADSLKREYKARGHLVRVIPVRKPVMQVDYARGRTSYGRTRLAKARFYEVWIR